MLTVRAVRVCELICGNRGGLFQVSVHFLPDCMRLGMRGQWAALPRIFLVESPATCMQSDPILLPSVAFFNRSGLGEEQICLKASTAPFRRVYGQNGLWIFTALFI